KIERQRDGRELPLVAHSDRGGGGFVVSNRAQWNDRAIGRAQINLIQSFRALPEFRINFHNHVILVQGREHRRHLPLTEGIVKRVIDQLRRDVQARRGRAVVNERGLKAIVLLVAIHVGEAAQPPHLLKQYRPPRGEVIQRFALNRVLVL